MRTVQYAEAREVFFAVPPGGRLPAGVPDTPGRRLRDAAEPLATVSFWAPEVNERLAALGLDFLTGYVWGRAAPMGEPTAPVVAAAFGVFEPGLVADLYAQARAAASRDAVLEAREQGSVDCLREVLAGVDDGEVAAAVAVLRRATDLAARDVVGRPLFAGLVSLPWPADPLGQLWHAASLLREYRGDVHQAANVAAGFSAVEMNLVTELWVGWEPRAYTSTRGWSPEAMTAAEEALARRGLLDGGALTAAGRALRDEVERRTDAAVAPLLEAIGPDLERVTAQLDGWAGQVVAGGAAPPDPYKRISG
jgi:hypothetical protein